MAKRKKNLLTQALKEKFENELKKSLNIVQGIKNRSTKMQKNIIPTHKFDDLYNLLYDKNILIQAFGNIEKNAGRLTKGVNLDTIDKISLERIFKISNDIKNNSYEWNPVRRIWIDKLKMKNKIKVTKKRPLGIPTFNDRIVQEAIRIILDSIYEPIFQSQECNFGFREKHSAHQAIEYIKGYATSSYFAVEGDIKGAYDNVNHDILMNILKEQITDNKFLKFIEIGLKNGILDKGHYEHSILGVPQGGIVSPLLFNIYMHKFDEYILKTLQNLIDKEINIKEDRKRRPQTNHKYNNLNTQISKFKLKMKMIKKNRKFIELNQEEKLQYLESRKKLKENAIKRLKEPSITINQRIVRLIYVRYADDFIILNNGNKKHNIFLKEKISEWLSTNLLLTLSEEKTYITNIRINAANFLGFAIHSHNTRRIQLNNFGIPQKRAGWNIVINVDINRYLERFQLKGFINKNYKPIAKLPWAVLQPEEIIKKYNFMIRGILNYYIPVIDRYSTLNRILYFLKFSCLGTFAKKYSSKITKITAKYGDPLQVTVVETKRLKNLGILTTEERIFTLLTYKYCSEIDLFSEIKFKYTHKRESYNDNGDIFNILNQTNWRTYKNLTNVCAICGTNIDVEQHHIKHIRKGKVIGFSQVLMLFFQLKDLD